MLHGRKDGAGQPKALWSALRRKHSAQPDVASHAKKRHVTNQSLARQAISSWRNLEGKWCELRALFRARDRGGPLLI
jgi:hypothetical protein